MWVRDSGLWVVAVIVGVACGQSASRNPDGGSSDAGEGGASETGGSASGGNSKGGSTGSGGVRPTGGSAGAGRNSEGGEAGSDAGGAGGGPPCNPDECPTGLACHDELGCAAICTVTEPVVIATQADLVAFAAKGCQVLEGSLVIRSPALVDLEALGAPNSLRIITGDLVIDQNPMLESLEGLLGLETIRGSLVVTANAFENLAGLQTLRFVGSNSVTSSLVIANNSELANVVALDELERLLAAVTVSNNPVLTTLAGIDRLRATSNVTITGNELLSELGGLTDLEEAGSLTIASNAGLLAVSFPSLLTVGSATITTNDMLSSISLPVLTTAESITIAGNRTLTTLGTLDTLVEVGSLVIAGNPMLPQCFVDALDLRLQACNMSCSGNDMTAVCN